MKTSGIIKIVTANVILLYFDFYGKFGNWIVNIVDLSLQ